MNSKEWTFVWYGTRKPHVLSIFKNGWKKPRKKVNNVKISIQSGHIPLGRQIDGISNLSYTVFDFPSIFYSAHEVYSEGLLLKRQEYNQHMCIVFHIAVRTGHFTSLRSTAVTFVKDKMINQLKWVLKQVILKLF
jgi:hypothetical protein